MKKILLVLCFILCVVACAHKELALPDTYNGVFRGNPTYTDAENMLYDACAKARWQVTSKSSGAMGINFDGKGFNFDALIQFTNTRYSIIFQRVNQDQGNTKEPYAVYKKYAAKLHKTIQKVSYNTR